MSKTSIITIILSGLCLVSQARSRQEVTDPAIISFEEGTAPAVAGDGSSLELSGEHFKHLASSLRWSWNTPEASFSIRRPIGYLRENPNPKETSVSTFVFWVYSTHPQAGKLRFEFRREGRTCSRFEYGLDFSGWRGAWIAFDRDMEGTPDEGMDELVVTAPDTPEGELFFDHIILSSFQDTRHHTADTQAPFINAGTTSHWLRLLEWWNDGFETSLSSESAERHAASMRTVEERLEKLMLEGQKAKPAKALLDRFADYEIGRNPDGTMRGRSIWFVRYAETYINLGHPEVKKLYAQEGVLLQQYNDLMFDIAVAYRLSKDEGERASLRAAYLDMTRHILDQGFKAGSAMGTLHHLGYSMRNFYTAPYLMRGVLREEGLDAEVQQAMEWFSGLGEVKRLPDVKGMDIDAFNTSLTGRLAALMIMSDGPRKAEYLDRFSRWVDNGLQIAEGTEPCFKSDGTVYHHRRHYPAYATGGFTGAVNAVWLFAGTDFRISRESHENLKRALLEMRFYCNLRSFPLALSGRHPDGKGALIPRHYSRLAEAGSPDGSQKIDRDLAAAFMRLAANPSNSLCKRFAEEGIEAEPSPEGCHVYGYNSSLSMRRGNWLLTAAGHSRYLWSAEIYQGANHYGRYLTHGSLQLLGSGDPVSAFGSGFRQEGWDWCHIPGTTAAVIPMERMKADVRNVDTFSGYEEMLLSDEAFAGGVSHRGLDGIYAMKLHEHDKYNGSLRARKSFFFVGNTVVALGSGIENAAEGSRTHTTLFQNALTDGHKDFTVNGEELSGAGHLRTRDGSCRIIDNFGVLYVVPAGKVTVESALQHSLHEETDAPTEGEFVKAYIDHGGKVEGAGYEYMMVVEPTGKQKEARKLPYDVVRCDSNAHIVDIGGIRGLVLFEAGETGDRFVSEVSLPSIVMYSDTKGGRRCVSVCDPDMRFYEGPSDEVFDADGKRTERSVYSRTWLAEPSHPSTLTVRVKGRWRLASQSEECRTERAGKDTLLIFACREGATREVELIKE